ncbi:hypothetical protein [Priestia koreensis]|uniref:hypothetical protein n=1 Tax=Priestia koreensis TaxID=284581 RepID=UPI001F57B3E5|nr:hypothetical protein [Priestia koreensis]UNL87514.1 hypothetical protein IE339_23700 [Priestia koreensis]
MSKSCDTCLFRIEGQHYEMKRCKKCSLTNRDFYKEEVQVPTAANKMEELMLSGLYPSKQHNQAKRNAIKKELMDRLYDSEEKRFVYKQLNGVAKFVTKKIYEVDTYSLNEYLDDKGLLLPIIKINNTMLKEEPEVAKLLAPYEEEPTYYARPSFNKKGKELNSSRIFPVQSWSDDELMKEYLLLKNQHQSLEAEYKRAMEEMGQCAVLQEKKKLTYEYGSISYIPHATRYRIADIHADLGEDFLYIYGEPHHPSLEEFLLKGTISQSEIDQFRTLKDIRVEFTIMSLESEDRQHAMFKERTLQMSMNRSIVSY